MSAAAHVEYVGFSTQETKREYRLRVQAEGGFHDFTVAIATEAFVAHRVRYQDAPDICFLRLQRELAGCEGAMPAAYLSITDADLEEYRQAHAPKPPQRRPKAPPVT
jgi:hypothetical protein